MKIATLSLALLLALPLWAVDTGGSAPPQLAFTADAHFLKLPPGVYFGECVGVAVDAAGNIYVANRGEHPLMEFRPDGTFLRYVAQGLDVFLAPHSVAIGPHGNIWYVDAGTNLVVELDPATRLLMVLGKKPEAWTWETHVVQHGPVAAEDFDQPTGIAFAPDGSVYITDGYGNSRVAHFSADGKFLAQWGYRGSEPGAFNTPHGVVIDPSGRVYVADRGNRRIQVFDATGRLLNVWSDVGAPWALCITPGPDPVIWSADGPAGRFYKLDLDGKVLGEFGTPGHAAGQFGWVHGIACPNANTIFAAEELNYRVQRLQVSGPGSHDADATSQRQ